MDNNILKFLIFVIIISSLFAFNNIALASEVIASPAAGTYNSAQTVTLTADGALTILYTTDGTLPYCYTTNSQIIKNGTVYSGPISVSASEIISAIACYKNDVFSDTATYHYAIVPTPAGEGVVTQTGSAPNTVNQGITPAQQANPISNIPASAGLSSFLTVAYSYSWQLLIVFIILCAGFIIYWFIKKNKINNFKMNNNKQITIWIIIGIVFFILGGALGVFYGTKEAPAQIKVKTENSLASKVVSSIVAYGQVQYIDGNNITLSNLGDTLVLSVPNSAKVYSFKIFPGSKTPVQSAASLGDIKEGDHINVNLKLLPNGQFEGSSVIILPPTAIDEND